MFAVLLDFLLLNFFRSAFINVRLVFLLLAKFLIPELCLGEYVLLTVSQFPYN